MLIVVIYLTVDGLLYMCYDRYRDVAAVVIVVINVRKKNKTLKNAFFILKIKKTFVNMIKNVTLFFTRF